MIFKIPVLKLEIFKLVPQFHLSYYYNKNLRTNLNFKKCNFKMLHWCWNTKLQNNQNALSLFGFSTTRMNFLKLYGKNRSYKKVKTIKNTVFSNLTGFKLIL